MKLDTAILGGMLTNMWTWSGMRCPSIISTPLPLAELPEDLPQVLAVLVVDCFLSILWAKHDVVGAHPFGVRKAVRFLCHGVLLSLAAGDLNNHHPRGKGVSLHSISVIHPQSGWFFALCTSHAGQVHEPQSKNSMFHLRSMLFFYSNSLFYLPIRHYSLSPPVALVAESDSPASDASGHTQSVNAG